MARFLVFVFLLTGVPLIAAEAADPGESFVVDMIPLPIGMLVQHETWIEPIPLGADSLTSPRFRMFDGRRHHESLDPDMIIDAVTRNDDRWDEVGYAITVRSIGGGVYLFVSLRANEVTDFRQRVEAMWAVAHQPVVWRVDVGLVEDVAGLIDGVVDAAQAQAWRKRLTSARSCRIQGTSGITSLAMDVDREGEGSPAAGLQVQGSMSAGLGMDALSVGIDWVLPEEDGSTWEWHPDIGLALPHGYGLVSQVRHGGKHAAMIIWLETHGALRQSWDAGRIRSYPCAVLTYAGGAHRLRTPLRGPDRSPAAVVEPESEAPLPMEIADEEPPEIGDFIEIVEEMVVPESWDADGVGIEEWGGSLIVSQEPAIHEQIEFHLRRLERAATDAVTLRIYPLPEDAETDLVIDPAGWSALIAELGPPSATLTQLRGSRSVHQAGNRSPFRGLATDLVIDYGSDGGWQVVGRVTSAVQGRWSEVPLDAMVPLDGAVVVEVGGGRWALAPSPAFAGSGRGHLFARPRP